MEHEAHVFFAVFEFGQESNVVTELAGFQPTDVWTTGQPTRKRPDITHRHSRWTFKSPLPLGAPIEEHFEMLLSALEIHAAGVRAVTARFPAHIGCAVYFHTFTPGFRFSQALLARVAALGLDIDFDFYFLGEDETADHNAEPSSRANSHQPPRF